MKPPYIYRPLATGHIRLFGLNVPPDCPLNTLQTFELSEAPAYYALSYTWGSRKRTRPLEVDGWVLSVGLNLYAAIRRLRGSSFEEDSAPVKWLWIDKICINQDDMSERSTQIQNVDTISNIRRSRSHWRLDALSIATSIKCHATDQRDKVYGLLGLAAENQDLSRVPDALRADYGLTIEQVYIRVALFFIREYKSLSILTRASGISSDVSRAQRKYKLDFLPTWVPNWCDFTVTEKHTAKSLSWLSHPNYENATTTLCFLEHYNASLGRFAELVEPLNESLLRLRGIKVDTVDKTTPFNSCGRSCEDSLLQFLEIALQFLPRNRDRNTLTDWIASWIKATTAEQYHLGGNTAQQILSDGSAFLFNNLRSYKHIPLCFMPQNNIGEIMDLLRELSTGGNPESYISLATNFCFNRNFIITLGGRMGIAPQATRREDLVFVIFGGGVPYIIRKQRGDSLFVGESYIDGLMRGEAVYAWQRGEMENEILELR
ncbi:heterokaryon incompatibility protein [Hirsutella rhossiliensis]|uniref:Heterokaryon incompatibility protein (HET) domain-containing protein n=1 Tax=Hirsutella rhossiliensis TaxID=111463 RepID=A0A9P8MQA5_9HYPO|nr:heterokaryon incompatibility protein (HET) domain-containing protein [Hirsutella rhossiliensis]KAH0959122.1 heterokaryon incompatibility protein (HET) domain-containing protein [Hirsutella rhossiliensis]